MYIVTGAAGFIGSAFVAFLNSQGIDDVLIVDELGHTERWKNIRGLRFRDYVHKQDFIENLRHGGLEWKVSAIVHLGADSSTTTTDVEFLMRNNYAYTKTLAEYALRHKIRFIYASSAATYGDGSAGYSDEHTGLNALKPLNPYGYSKQIFDQHALQKGWLTRMAGLKFFNVYGPNEYHKGAQRSVVHQAYEQIKATGSVRLFKSYRPDYKDGEQQRDFIYIKDCNQVMWWLISNPKANGIFNLGTGKARSWIDLANAVFAALGKKPKIEFIDMPDNLRRQYQYFTQAEMTKLAGAGYQAAPTSLEDGVRDYVVNYLEKENPYFEA